MDWLSNIFGEKIPMKTRICRNKQKERIENEHLFRIYSVRYTAAECFGRAGVLDT